MGDNLAEIFALHGRGTARNGTVTAAYSEFNDRDFIYHVTRDLGKFSDMVAKLYMYASSGGSAGALQYLASNRHSFSFTNVRKKKVDFPDSAGRTPKKQFCFSESAPFRTLSPYSKLWCHICSQMVKQWWT